METPSVTSSVVPSPDQKQSKVKVYNYKGKAQRRWRYAAWISGVGRFALLASCGRGLTVCLYKTLPEAEHAKAYIDETGCGGGCWKGNGHHIVDLETATLSECLTADKVHDLRN
jgi:hypothetical protein